MALGGIVAIVAVVIGVLFAAGLIGNQAGGEGIEDVVLSEPVRLAGQEELEVGTDVGQLSPDFEISAFDGTRHKLSDFRGKPVYINFWATWCTPCVIELPEIQALLEEHGDDLVVVTVNRTEPLGNARSFLEDLPRKDGGTGLEFTVNGMDPSDALYDEFVPIFPPPMPVSVFIDRDGVVSDRFFTIISPDLMEEAVEKASDGNAPG